MDPSHYKETTVYGTQYVYYYTSPSSDNKPTLLFLHGFPSTSEHWIHQVTHFSAKGYGILAPDMLGFGGTSKPEDPNAYNYSDLAAHCAAILDTEGLERVVVVAHDWGCEVASKLANLYPERHLASVFLSVPYCPPNTDQSAEETIEDAKKTCGHDIFSYWKFFSSEEAPQILSAHEDSFYSLLFCAHPSYWKTYFSPDGELKKWLLADKKAPVASWAPNRRRHSEAFRAGGWVAPTNWYRCIMEGITIEANKVIPKDRYDLHHPVLLVPTLRDPICLPDRAKVVAMASCTNLTVRELDTGHWVMLEKPHELNAVMEEFMQQLGR